MARKSGEDKAIAENLTKITELQDRIKTLVAVNDALAAIRDAKRTLKPPAPLSLAREA